MKDKIYTEDEYTTVTEEDDDRIVNIKEKLKKFRKVERDIFLTYVNEGTYAAVAKKYNVSAPTAKSYINIIKEKLKC
jgi:hypothetical protein